MIIPAIPASALLLGLVLANAPASEPPAGGDSGNDLSSKATDPTASLMAINLQTTYTGDYYGSIADQPDYAWDVAFRAAIPWDFLGHPNILRITAPYRLDGRGDDGWGPVSVFDLFMTNESWGRWGIGPVMSFDTTGDAPDEFVIGPALGFVHPVNKKLNVGLFTQNVFGSDTAVTQIQPVLAYQLGNGWSLSAGDLQFTYDWEAGQWTNAPIGFQIGKVTKLGSQPVRFSVNPQYNLLDRDGLNEWSCTFTFTALFPTR